MKSRSKKREDPQKKTGKLLRTNIFLDETQRREIEELARKEKRTFSSMVRAVLDDGVRVRKRQQWEQAAERMASTYASDSELTAFTALDSEDFVEEG